jgi:hypothetical protein
VRRVLVALAVAALAVVAFAGWIFLRPSPPVTVVVVNGSSKPIESVVLRHEHGYPPIWTTVLCPGIPVRGRITIEFPVRSEASYELKVHFRDGTELTGGGGYAEPGYHFTDTVLDTEVKSEVRLSGY